MLDAIGVDSVSDLFQEIPPGLRLRRPLAIGRGLTELELERQMQRMAAENRSTRELVSFLGGGFYDRFIPAAVDALVSRGEFATAYTPYQPELSQGTLAAIFEYQTMIASLAGLDVAQASLYDGASAAGEAALMALGRRSGGSVVMPRTLSPEVRAVVTTYVHGRGGRTVVVDGADDLASAAGTKPAAMIWPYPDLFGDVLGLVPALDFAREEGALAVVYADPVALAVLTPPGALGADVVVGEGQPLGNPQSFGGPTFGFMAVRSTLTRRLPGRLVGMTSDADGRRGFVLTLQAREQHIRRDKATSNVCSNHSLNALRAAIYLSLLGPEGLREVAMLSIAKASYLASRLTESGLEVVDSDRPKLFEFVVRIPGSVAELNRYLVTRGILGGADLGRLDPDWQGLWQLAVTERRTREEMDRLVEEVLLWMSR